MERSGGRRTGAVGERMKGLRSQADQFGSSRVLGGVGWGGLCKVSEAEGWPGWIE